MGRIRTTAIVLAAGQGKRMNSKTAKQYLLLGGKPVLYYSLKAFQESMVDEIILVTGGAERDFVKKEIVEKYGFTKVCAVVEGGRERYMSVYLGLRAARALQAAQNPAGDVTYFQDRVYRLEKSGKDADVQALGELTAAGMAADCAGHYCFIHDGARPFLTQDVLERAFQCAVRDQACVVGMPVKDTVKIADEDGYAADTPKRSLVWMIQTPQVFSFPLICDAYDKLILQEESLLEQGIQITDDACVVELLTDRKVKLVEGSYQNIKITTPEDLKIAEAFLLS